MQKKFVCFGETLWDVLPTGKQPGGAPFNVAVHLHQLGASVKLISRVGDDELGAELLAFLEEKGVSTEFIQRGHTHLTGVVKANVDNQNEVTYKIVQPVAWDYIQHDAAVSDLVAAADVFVYGSLAARSQTTRETLYQLLQDTGFKVFDVNLRPPHYTQAVVEYLLGQADLVKMNHHELDEIMPWFGESAEEETALPWLAAHFGLQAVCVTKGADGAVLWANNQFYRSPGIPVEVKDTIGSGDAFLAALLKCWHSDMPPADCLRFACAAGSLVATHQGATPVITEAIINEFLKVARPA